MGKKGIGLTGFSICSIIIAVILMVVLFVTGVRCSRSFETVNESEQKYSDCSNAAQQLQEASDYLMEMARLYVFTADIEYMDAYFEELHETKRRENAFDTLSVYLKETESFEYLEKVMRGMAELMDIECHAMKLAAVAKQIPAERLPDEINKYTLTGTEPERTALEQMQLAKVYVFDRFYQQKRNNLAGALDTFVQKMTDITSMEKEAAAKKFENLIMLIKIECLLLTLVIFINSVIMIKSIVLPLNTYRNCISGAETLPLIGAAELRHLAETYNSVFRENEESKKLIRYDALTGVLNKGAFMRLQKSYISSNERYALVLADVDIFKSINDIHGHEVGDMVLQKVAKLLLNTFRSSDYVCRIGGDEFAMIVVDVDKSHKSVIEGKINKINQLLSETEDGLPAVSLSVGVAFSERGISEQDHFSNADKALYYVKKHGRCGCHIYNPSEFK